MGKVIRILERLNQAPGEILLGEILTATDVNQRSRYRFLSNLESEGFVLRESHCYDMVAPKLTRLGSGATYQATLCRTNTGVLEAFYGTAQDKVVLAICRWNNNKKSFAKSNFERFTPQTIGAAEELKRSRQDLSQRSRKAADRELHGSTSINF